MTDIVALQLYTVRDETAKDFKQTIRKVAEIGYAGVEFAGYDNLSAAEMATLLKETGLKAAGTHVGLQALEQDFDSQIKYCLEIGCNLLVVPWLPENLRTGEAFSRLATQFNDYGRRCQAEGITFAYHNHDFEFRQNNGEMLIERLTTNTDPAYVKLELDTFWAAYAGVDPIKFIKKHSGRIASLHLKDMTPDRKFAEVGDGTLDIAGYKEAAQAAGTTIFIVENDSPQIPSLESARRSFENIHRSLT